MINFPARSIRNFGNRFTTCGGILILVKAIPKKVVIFDNPIIYNVGLHSKFNTFCQFSKNLVVFLRSASTKIKIPLPLVKRFPKFRMLRAGKLMLCSFLEH